MKDLALECPLDDADPVRSFRMARTIVVVETRRVAYKKRHYAEGSLHPGCARRLGPEPAAISDSARSWRTVHRNLINRGAGESPDQPSEAPTVSREPQSVFR